MKYLHIAEAQHGVLHRRQLLDCGVHPPAIARLLAAGRLIQVHRAVYRLAGMPATRRQALSAACLAADPATASHRSAAELLGIGNVRSVGPEITVPGGTRPRLKGVTIHRTNAMDACDIAAVDGIPCSTVPRTVLDLGAVLPWPRVESAMEDAVLRLGTEFPALRDCLDRIAARGRNGCGILRTLLDARDPNTAPGHTELELAVGRLIKRYNIDPGVPQYRLEMPGRRPIVLDRAWPDIKFGIEADSRVWHSGRRDVQRNSEKRNTWTMLGWSVLCYTWFDIKARPAEVATEILGFVARSGR